MKYEKKNVPANLSAETIEHYNKYPCHARMYAQEDLLQDFLHCNECRDIKDREFRAFAAESCETIVESDGSLRYRYNGHTYRTPMIVALNHSKVYDKAKLFAHHHYCEKHATIGYVYARWLKPL